MKRCPYCAELIQDAALVCRYCGRDLETGLVPSGGRSRLGLLLVVLLAFGLLVLAVLYAENPPGDGGSEPTAPVQQTEPTQPSTESQAAPLAENPDDSGLFQSIFTTKAQRHEGSQSPFTITLV